MGLGVLAAALTASPGWGADKQHPSTPRTATDDILVNGKRDTACPPAKGTIDYTCLNGDLQAAASAGQPAPPAADAATSQVDVPSRVGTFSYSATHQRLGSNFGHSVTPARPPAPTFINPITAGRPK